MPHLSCSLIPNKTDTEHPLNSIVTHSSQLELRSSLGIFHEVATTCVVDSQKEVNLECARLVDTLKERWIKMSK